MTDAGSAPHPGSGELKQQVQSRFGVGCLGLIILLFAAVGVVLMAGVRPWETPAASPAAASGALSSAAAPVAASMPVAASASAAATPAPTAIAAQQTAIAPQQSSAAAGTATPTPRASIAARLLIPTGFVVTADPAGGAKVQWVELAGGIDPDHFSVKMNGSSVANVPFVAGTIEYQTTVSRACGALDVVVVAVQGSVQESTAPFHVVLPPCP
ncbi:MAG: hypothetical protein U0838_02300 [Chloroflexota bacterium]